jgi:hypothetical protein
MIMRIYHGIKRRAKKLVSYPLEYKNKYDDLLFMFDRYVNCGVAKAYNFDFDLFADEVIAFVKSMKIGIDGFDYKYAPSGLKPALYNSLYACLLYFLLGREKTLPGEQIKSWGAYFNSFQREDGFFIDTAIESELYYSIDWWGGRHIAPHVIICLRYLNEKPRYEFNYIRNIMMRKN